MTGRTHDLAAFTALGLVAATQPLPHISLGTLLVAICVNLIGGLAPDIDQPTASLWRKLPAGTVFGKLFAPLLGGHRFISHSIFGLLLFGVGFKYLLILSSHTLIVNESIVWWAFMIGFASHLVMDTITREGVPWFFPIPIRFGIPPFRHLRMKTGGLLEKSIIFPGLLLSNAIFYYSHYHYFLIFLKHYLH